jgi:hypothetical protein
MGCFVNEPRPVVRTVELRPKALASAPWSFAGPRFNLLVLIATTSKSVHLIFDLSAQDGCLSDEPIQVFNLPSQLLDIWDLGHVRIDISALSRPAYSRNSEAISSECESGYGEVPD